MARNQTVSSGETPRTGSERRNAESGRGKSPELLAFGSAILVVVLAFLPGIIVIPSSISEALSRYDPRVAVTAATACAIIAYTYFSHRTARATEHSVRASIASAEAASETADATERSFRLLAAEKRRSAAESLHVLREELQRLERIAIQRQRSLVTPGGDPPLSDLFDSETIQDLRGRAAGVGGEAGSKVGKALDTTDKVNEIIREAARLRNLHGRSNPYNEDRVSDLDQALTAVQKRCSEAERAVTDKLDRFQAAGPYEPLPELTHPEEVT